MSQKTSKEQREKMRVIFKNARFMLNETLKSFSNKLGVSLNYLYQIESGRRNPSYQLKRRLINHLRKYPNLLSPDYSYLKKELDDEFGEIVEVENNIYRGNQLVDAMRILKLMSIEQRTELNKLVNQEEIDYLKLGALLGKVISLIESNKKFSLETKKALSHFIISNLQDFAVKAKDLA